MGHEQGRNSMLLGHMTVVRLLHSICIYYFSILTFMNRA
jgi:hypothetical protein